MNSALGDVLARMIPEPAFCAEVLLPTDALAVEIDGVGLLRGAISPQAARKLAAASEPARFGQGTETVLDRAVRDAGVIAAGRLRLDEGAWAAQLGPALDALARRLGVPLGQRLRPRLHDLLVYGRGQFFLPHRDSERSDDMVGTLLVDLPCTHQGGELVVMHGRERRTFTRASEDQIRLIAFYADCLHEVRPVLTGTRVVLTFNLSLEGEAAHDPSSPLVLEAVTDALRTYFETPVAPLYGRQGAARPPQRLVYLLDHQYSARSLDWSRLKPPDDVRVAALLAAAERTTCAAGLARADVHETWAVAGDPYARRTYGDPSRVELDYVVDDSVTLSDLVDRAGERMPGGAAPVRREELLLTLPSRQLEPHRAEHEPYMGNYGNTVDRWYHRAALVIWPAAHDFLVRARASVTWAVEQLEARTDRPEELAARLDELAPYWRGLQPETRSAPWVDRVLALAARVGDAERARVLVSPLDGSLLGVGAAPALLALAHAYGVEWVEDRMEDWRGARRSWDAARVFAELGERLPAMVLALSTPRSADAEALSQVLVEVAHAGLVEAWGEGDDGPSRDVWLEQRKKLIPSVLGLLVALRTAHHPDVRARVPALFEGPVAAVELVPALLALAAAQGLREDELGLDDLRATTIAALTEAEARPARALGDWSIVWNGGCGCELCGSLRTFLVDAAQRRMVWPLSKDDRRHVHAQLDAYALPVTHETRREGKPHKLVLEKTPALFASDASARAQVAKVRAELERGGGASEATLGGDADTTPPRAAGRRRAGAPRLVAERVPVAPPAEVAPPPPEAAPASVDARPPAETPGSADSSGTNAWCRALGIDRPRLADVAHHRGANTYARLLVALLEEGGPLTLEQVALRLEQVGVAHRDDALLSLQRCKPARSPVYRDGDRYLLEPRGIDLDLWLSRLGLRARPASVTASSPNSVSAAAPAAPAAPATPPPGPDAPLTEAELDEAWTGASLSTWSAVRVAVAVLDAHGAPWSPAEVVAAAQRRATGCPLAVDHDFRRRRSAVRALEDGRWALADDAADAVRAVRAALRASVASARTAAVVRARAHAAMEAYEARRNAQRAVLAKRAHAVLAAFPAAAPQVVALVDVGAREVTSFAGAELAALGPRLAAFHVIAAVAIRPLLRALGVDPGERALVELGPPQKSKKLNRSGRALAITTAMLVQGSCGLSRPLGDPAAMAKQLAAGQIGKVRVRMEADAKSLHALYMYGRLHGVLRLRWGFIDEPIAAPWADPDDAASLGALLDEAEARGTALEVVTGSAPGWAEPWARARRVEVRHARGFARRLVDAEGREVARAEVQAARVVE